VHGATDDFGLRRPRSRAWLISACDDHGAAGVRSHEVYVSVCGRDFRLTDVYGEVVRNIWREYFALWETDAMQMHLSTSGIVPVGMPNFGDPMLEIRTAESVFRTSLCSRSQ